MMGTGDMRSDASTRDIHCSRCGESQNLTELEAAAYKLTHKCVWLTADQEIWMRAYITMLGNRRTAYTVEGRVSAAVAYAELSLTEFKKRFDHE